MVLGVLQNGFTLIGVRVEIGVGGADSIPMAALQDAVIIGGWCVVAKGDIASVNSVDVPSLGVVASHAVIVEEGLPIGEVVVGQLEKIGHAFFTANEVQQGLTYTIIHTIHKVIGGLGGVDDGR